MLSHKINEALPYTAMTMNLNMIFWMQEARHEEDTSYMAMKDPRRVKVTETESIFEVPGD